MKKYSTLFRVLLLVLFCSISSNLLAQSFRTACPYNVASWPYPNYNEGFGCPPATFNSINGPLCPIFYKTKPHQDCCGALRPCSTTIDFVSIYDTLNRRFNTSVCGQGCSLFDLPPVGTTCFGGNERQTAWLSIEIGPLPGQPYVLGAPAGKLRFKIIPCDVYSSARNCGNISDSIICKCDSVDVRSPAICNDMGASDFGSTDYDWILFQTSQYNSRRPACTSISSNNSTVVCCNWSALRGPTGIFELPEGPTPSCDNGALGSRYAAPISVNVGDKFMLAIDAFTSGSSSGVKIDFSGICANELINGPTAQLKIDTGNIVNFISVQPDVENGYSSSINFQLNTELVVGSFQLNELSLYQELSVGNFYSVTDSLLDLLPLNDLLIASTYRLETGLLSEGRYALVLQKTTPSDCGIDRISIDTAYFVISNSFAGIHIDSIANPCFLEPIRLSVDPVLYHNVVWNTGQEGNEILVSSPGTYIVFVEENGNSRIVYSDTIKVQQRSLRNCPISITQNPGLDSLTASLPALRYQWELNNIIISRVTKRIPITANGSYRVRAINGRDTGIWSAPFLVTSNKLTAKSGGLNVYPNPSKGIVNIQVPSGFQSIELSDKLGKVLLTKPIQNTTTINVQGYPKGVYTIRAKGGGQALSTQLIVE